MYSYNYLLLIISISRAAAQVVMDPDQIRGRFAHEELVHTLTDTRFIELEIDYAKLGACVCVRPYIHVYRLYADYTRVSFIRHIYTCIVYTPYIHVYRLYAVYTRVSCRRPTWQHAPGFCFFTPGKPRHPARPC